MEHQDQAFLDMIIKLIVTEPGAVEITRTVDDLGVLITLKVSKEDMGRVIGKDGQTAKAIRTLLRAIGSRNNVRVNMKILEPEGSEMEIRSEDAPVAAPAMEDAAPEMDTPAVETPEVSPSADGDVQFTAPAEEAPVMAPEDRPMPGDDIDI